MDGLILHEFPLSGNCYKIRLTAAHVGIKLERRAYDISKGETRTPEFLRDINANGRIPVLQDGDRFLTESNAICYFLANGSKLIPEGHYDQADMLRWMFWEQYNHEPNVATLRFWIAFVGEEKLTPQQREQLPGRRVAGDAALRLMDEHLEGRDWFVGEAISLADIALYAYTHVAEAGGFRLADYPAVQAWLGRVAVQPGYVSIDA